MRILWVSDHNGDNGGGLHSQDILIRYLRSTEHEIQVVIGDELRRRIFAQGPWEVKQQVMGKLLTNFVRKILVRDPPDLVVSQGNYFSQIGKISGKFGIPHLVFIRDHFYRCPNALHDSCSLNCWTCIPMGQHVMYPLVKFHIKQKINALRMADMIITNSLFMKKELEDFTDKTVNVLFPPIDFDGAPRNWSRNGSHDKVMYMGCGYWKGTKLVMDLARKLPHFDFVLAGDESVPTRWNLRDYPNVDWLPWIDRDLAFDIGRVLLFPSLWPEPFGRIPVEAGQRGIPTIGSSRGGVPESVGDGGVILDPEWTNQWLYWTSLLMECDDMRNNLGHKAQEHSVKFGIQRVGPQFEGYLSQLDR